jgi:transposase
MLYLFQSKQVETGRKISALLGKNEATIYRWLFQYKEGGLENLLKNGRFLVAQKISQD